jgi:hypothetical protein
MGKPLGKPKVNNVKRVSLIADPYQEVVSLDIALEEILGMDVFDSGNGLVSNKEDGFDRKSSAVVFELVLNRRAEDVMNQRVEVTFLPRTTARIGF